MTPYIILIEILVLVTSIICIAFFKSRNENNKTANYGEWRVKNTLNDYLHEGDKLINNIILYNPKNGKSSEIDHILISENGIFVIETKDYIGNIHGDDKSKEWLQSFDNSSKINKLRSPVMQNFTHVFLVKHILKKDYFINNVVVFTQANLNKVTSKYVTTLWNLPYFLSNKYSTKFFSVEEREEIYQTILQYQKIYPVSKSEHLHNIYKK